jgi:hypothetical protein
MIHFEGRNAKPHGEWMLRQAPVSRAAFRRLHIFLIPYPLITQHRYPSRLRSPSKRFGGLIPAWRAALIPLAKSGRKISHVKPIARTSMTQTSTYESDNPSAEDMARVKVRGTNDDEKFHDEFAAWESAVAADAAANGGVVTPKSRPLGNRVVRLLSEPAVLAPPSDTETELNRLIAECRYLIHEVACTSARLTYDPDDRIRFLASAQSMVLTAAKVGRTVAQLRATAGGARVETHLHEMVYRHEHTTLSPSPLEADSSHQ